MSWHDQIEFFQNGDFDNIIDLIHKEKSSGKIILPDYDEILNAFAYTPLDEVRVVILGQDPYPTPGHAHGLAFSVRPEIKPLPGSLRNIYKELKNDLGGSPENGSLIAWAEQGVLLLNTSLTVEAGQAGSHKDIGWRNLTKQAIKLVSEERPNTVFVLWGRHAQDFKMYIQNRKNHLILESTHPSPLSANRGFFGSKPFSKINDYLKSNNQKPIVWF